MEVVALISDMLQIIVKLHFRRHHDANQNRNWEQSNHDGVPVVRIIVDLVNQIEDLLFTLRIFVTKEMRQENERKERIADQGEGGKQSEIPQQFALGEHQAEERADGGEASETNRLRFVLQHLFHISHKTLMDKYMQTIADGRSQHHRADAHRHERHFAFDPIDARQREEGAVCHR